MADWQITHGKAHGAFLRAGSHEVYVREAVAEEPASGWRWLVDGILMGVEPGESEAKAAAEACVRAMGRTHTARLAASADQLGPKAA
jgi:hypothetical protein